MEFEEINKCPNCGFDNPSNSSFCSQCGTDLRQAVNESKPMFCEQCGNKLKPGANFCNKCGAKIKSPNSAIDKIANAANDFGRTAGLKINNLKQSDFTDISYGNSSTVPPLRSSNNKCVNSFYAGNGLLFFGLFFAVLFIMMGFTGIKYGTMSDWDFYWKLGQDPDEKSIYLILGICMILCGAGQIYKSVMAKSSYLEIYEDGIKGRAMDLITGSPVDISLDYGNIQRVKRFFNRIIITVNGRNRVFEVSHTNEAFALLNQLYNRNLSAYRAGN